VLGSVAGGLLLLFAIIVAAMVWVFYFRRRTTPVGAYELMGAPKTNQNEAL